MATKRVKRRLPSVTAPTQRKKRAKRRASPAVRLKKRKLAAKRKARLTGSDKKFDKVRGKVTRRRRTKKTGKRKSKTLSFAQLSPGLRAGRAKIHKEVMLDMIAKGKWESIPKKKRSLLLQAKKNDYSVVPKGLTAEEVKAAADGVKRKSKSTKPAAKRSKARNKHKLFGKLFGSLKKAPLSKTSHAVSGGVDKYYRDRISSAAKKGVNKTSMRHIFAQPAYG